MIKQLSKSIREYKKDSILAGVFVILEVISDLTVVFLMADLIDNGVDKGNLNHLIKVGILLVVISAGSLVFGALSGFYAAYASSGFGKNLRSDLFQKIQKFSFENIDKFSTSSLITRLTTDITNIQGAYQMIVRTAVRAPITILFSIIVTFFINPSLAIIYLIAIPFVSVGLYFIIMKVHPIFVKVFNTYDSLNRVVQENVHGIRVVKSFVQEDKEIEKFTDISDEIYQDFSYAEKILAFNGPVLQSGIYACMLAISWFGAKLIISSTMTTGELMSMLSITMQILINLMLLSMVFVMIVIARTGAERSVEILNEEVTLKNTKSPIYNMDDSTIKFDNVSFSYSKKAKKHALSNISFTINPGETVGIIGGTGSSKTTLVQLIPRLYDVTEGNLTIGDINVKKYDLNTLRNEVAMVLQKNVLFSGSILENLRWDNENATLEEIKQAANWAQAADFIEKLPEQYESYVEQGGANFSGGQKQRLCIARALLKNPKILILDDSTSAVDTKTDASIRKAFMEEIPNTTKIIIAQRLASIKDANKIIVMENGQIDDIGTHEELLSRSQIYKEVYASQNQGGFDE